MVITICSTPSRRQAASATSAIIDGVLTAMVAPASSDSSIEQKRQRSASSYRTQVWTTVVASTFAPWRRAICS